MTSILASFDRLGASLRRAGSVVGDIGSLVQQQQDLKNVTSDIAAFIEDAGSRGTDSAGLQNRFEAMRKNLQGVVARTPSLRGPVALQMDKAAGALEEFKDGLSFQEVQNRSRAVFDQFNAGDQRYQRQIRFSGILLGTGYDPLDSPSEIFRNARNEIVKIYKESGRSIKGNEREIDELTMRRMLTVITKLGLGGLGSGAVYSGGYTSGEAIGNKLLKFFNDRFTDSEKERFVVRMRNLNPLTFSGNVTRDNVFQYIIQSKMKVKWKWDRNRVSLYPQSELSDVESREIANRFLTDEEKKQPVGFVASREQGDILNRSFSGSASTIEIKQADRFLTLNTLNEGLLAYVPEMTSIGGQIAVASSVLGFFQQEGSAEGDRNTTEYTDYNGKIQSAVNWLLSGDGEKDRLFESGGLNRKELKVMALLQAVSVEQEVKDVKGSLKKFLYPVGSGWSLFRQFSEANDDDVASVAVQIVRNNYGGLNDDDRGISWFGKVYETIDIIQEARRTLKGSLPVKAGRVYLNLPSSDNSQDVNQFVGVNAHNARWRKSPVDGYSDDKFWVRTEGQEPIELSGVGITNLEGEAVFVSKQSYDAIKEGGIVLPFVDIKNLNGNVVYRSVGGGRVGKVGKDPSKANLFALLGRYDIGDPAVISALAREKSIVVVSSMTGDHPNYVGQSIHAIRGAQRYVRDMVSAGLADTPVGVKKIELEVAKRYKVIFSFRLDNSGTVQEDVIVAGYVDDDLWARFFDEDRLTLVVLRFPSSSGR